MPNNSGRLRQSKRVKLTHYRDACSHAERPLLYPVIMLDLLQGHPGLRFVVAPFGLAAPSRRVESALPQEAAR